MPSFPEPFALAKAFLHRLDPETAHELTLRALETGFVPARRTPTDPMLATNFLGHALEHPIGLAAGFDKNARVFARMFEHGFSFVEIGGVTPLAQAGNSRPRVFRLPFDRAVVNRIGFANDGMDAVAARLAAQRTGQFLAVNLAANADSVDPADDFVQLAQRFAPLAHMLTLDISCPNTANGQLFCRKDPLEDLLGRLGRVFSSGTRRPLLAAKLAPDLAETEVADIVGVLQRFGIDALIVSNTTASREGVRDAAGDERGGLSGRPLFARSTQLLATVFALTHGRIPLVGVGGIASGADAYAKLRAGATVLQLYTAMIYEGPAVVARIKTELAALLRADGFGSTAEAIGTSGTIPA